MTDISPRTAKIEQLQAKQHLPKGLCMVEVTSYCPVHGSITRQVVNMIAQKAKKTCPECAKEAQKQAERQQLIQLRKEQAQRAGINHYKPFDVWQADSERKASILSFMSNYAQAFGEQSANVIMVGQTGTGKTLMANLIASHLINHNRSVCFIRSSQICEQARATWNKYAQTTEQALIEHWTGVDLLVIDEFGEADTAINPEMAQADRERMSRIIDGRYSRQLPTIITSNLTKDEMIQRLGDRAWDRLQQNAVFIAFDWSSYRQTNSNFLEI